MFGPDCSEMDQKIQQFASDWQVILFHAAAGACLSGKQYTDDRMQFLTHLSFSLRQLANLHGFYDKLI